MFARLALKSGLLVLVAGMVLGFTGACLTATVERAIVAVVFD